jgi:hypothetical protein
MDEHGHWQALSSLEQSESGILMHWLERIATEQRVMTPSIVVRREVYEKLGGFDSRLLCSEDWEMWVRIAAHYPVWYAVEPLAVYRMHSASNTGRHIQKAEHLQYTRKAIEIFKMYLPSQIAAALCSKARETYALSALDMAYAMIHRQEIAAALAHSREGLKFRCSLRVIRHFIRFFVWAAAYWSRQMLAPKTTVGGKTQLPEIPSV